VPEPLSISVIIPTNRRPQLLHNALASLLKQTRKPDQVVVAAAAEDELSRTELGHWHDKFAGAGVELVTPTVTEDTMMARQNAAIAGATQDIVAFLDDDAAAREVWLERLLHHYDNPRVGAVGGRDVVWLDGKEYAGPADRVGQVSWFGRLQGNHHKVSPPQEVSFLKGCNMSYRRELVSKLDPRLRGTVAYAYEIDLGLQVRARGLRIIYDPQAAVDHYPSSDMNADVPALARVVNHNQTYVLLKRLPPLRRASFVIYSVLIGDLNTVGLLRAPWLRWRRHWSWTTIRAHWQGKREGYATYVSAKHDNRVSSG
jgi:GT2 family glycosyltransferase